MTSFEKSEVESLFAGCLVCCSERVSGRINAEGVTGGRLCHSDKSWCSDQKSTSPGATACSAERLLLRTGRGVGGGGGQDVHHGFAAVD